MEKKEIVLNKMSRFERHLFELIRLRDVPESFFEPVVQEIRRRNGSLIISWEYGQHGVILESWRKSYDISRKTK
jgi:hypothetical protein